MGNFQRNFDNWRDWKLDTKRVSGKYLSRCNRHKEKAKKENADLNILNYFGLVW